MRPMRWGRCAQVVLALALPVVSAAGAQSVDRSKQPAVGPAVALRFPEIQVRRLSNGITIAVVEDHEIPTVQVRAVLNVGALLDPVGKEGVAELTAAMLNEGTTSMTEEQIAEASAAIGTPVSSVFFHTVKPNVDRALSLMADQLIRPAFSQAALDRIKGTRVATLKRSRGEAAYLAARIFANAAYGAGHPLHRTVSEQSLAAISRADLQAFHDDYYRPQNVSFVVGGDITANEAVVKMERAFGAWPAGGRSGSPDVPTPAGPDSTRIYIHDTPGAAQTLIMLAQVGPSRDTPDYYALRLANVALGGGPLARLFTNLRQKYGFTYGVTSTIQYRRKPLVGAIFATTSVHGVKTDTALAELFAEMRDFRGARPLTEAELSFARTSQVNALPREYETITQKVNAVATLLSEELPLDYYRTLSDNLSGVTLEQARGATARHLTPAKMAIVLIGDRKVIEPSVRRLGIAPVVIVDEAGKPVS